MCSEHATASTLSSAAQTLEEISADWRGGSCWVHVCVYSLQPAGGSGVSWPVWDGGVTPRLVSPQDQRRRGWRRDCSQLCRDVYFVFLMSVCGEYIYGQRTLTSQTQPWLQG